MKAFIISLSRIEQSISFAKTMIEPLTKYGFEVELFEGSYGDEMEDLFENQGRTFHPTDHLEEPSIANRKTAGPGAKGCFYSHYRLWQKCIELDEPIWVFEDDIEFIRPYYPVDFKEVLITVVGSWKQIFDIDPYIEPNIVPQALDYDEPCIPGTPGYAIKPKAAKKLVKHFANTYYCSDGAMRSSVINLQIHSHLIGRPLTDEDGKISLTRTNFWKSK